MAAHPAKDEWRAEQQHGREGCRETKSQNRRVERKRASDGALAGAERARNRG